MNLTSRTRSVIAASLVLVGLAAGVSQAQTVISVNGSACGTATVMLGAGTINIDTTGCSAPPTVVPPAIIGVSPPSAKAGAAVTISGTGLAGASVTFGGVAAGTTTSSATSISTIVPASAPIAAGSLVVTTSAGTATASFTVEAPGAGEFSIDGIAVPAISKQPTVTPTHNGLNGAGQYMNAYAMDPARCNTTPALRRSWQHNIDLGDYRSRTAVDIFSLQGDEALSYKITIPVIDASGGITYLDNIGSGANLAPAFITITATPCDFNTSKTVPYPQPGFDACYKSASAGLGFAWANVAGALPFSTCRLTKGQTYYVNIRFQDAMSAPTATSCAAGVLCGGSIAFQ